MTPDYLIDAPYREQVDTGAPAWPEEPLFGAAAPVVERPSADARITRDASAPHALAAVVGLGHGGLPTAMALRRAGFRIVGIDTSATRLGDIRGGRAELAAGAQEELRAHLGDPDFSLSDSVEAAAPADLVLICVPATVDRQGRPNLEALRRTCGAIVQHARAGQTLVLASAGPVGSTRELLVEPLAERGLRAGEDVFVAFSPERADHGVPEHDQLRGPRVIGAVSETCFRHASELLRHTCSELHRVSSPEAAEMCKLYESTFRTVNIALACELADACSAAGLDPVEVTQAAATKPFGFMAHLPSAGIGGRAVADPHHLLAPMRERGRPATITEEALRTVAARPRRVAMRAHELLLRSGKYLRDIRVLVVGASYKSGVADAANAPAAEIISRLQAEGVQVDYHDPLVSTLRVDGEPIHSVDPDPRRDRSGFGPEDYELAILVCVQPGFDYGWLRRCPQVLDCTYEQHTGCRRYLP